VAERNHIGALDTLRQNFARLLVREVGAEVLLASLAHLLRQRVNRFPLVEEAPRIDHTQQLGCCAAAARRRRRDARGLRQVVREDDDVAETVRQLRRLPVVLDHLLR